MKQYSLVAIMMVAILFAACSGDENIVSKQSAARTFTLTVNATKGDATTRALTLDGTTLNATWTMGDAVTVYNVTRSANLTGILTAQSDGVSTTLVGSLTGTIESGDKLKLKYLSPTYSSQDGTLATIASTCDYAEAEVTVNDASTSPITTTTADFKNQQAIVKFTLKDKTSDASINATKLTVTAGEMTINVTPSSATDILYVAIPGISSQTVYLSATAGGTNYIYEKPNVTLDKGKYYGFTVSMNEAVDVSSEPLTFEAKEAGATVTFTKASSVANQIEYSTDGTTWATYSEPITLSNVGDKVYFRGNNAAYGASSEVNSSKFSCSNSCYVYGNIMSLVSSTGFATATELTEDYTFTNLFRSNDKIYNHPTKKLELPAITLTEYCYSCMFYSCTSLTTVPELPATTLTQFCYYSMFNGCTSLTTASELPATTLARHCYSYMFNGCTSLTTAPTTLPATTLAIYCYYYMFNGCTSLTTAPELPATTLTQFCYYSMFNGCTSLTTAPELPATTLDVACYHFMFNGCTSLTTVPTSLPATTLKAHCYNHMFYGCTSLTTAPELPATTLAVYCYNNMFNGCTNLTTAPALPATTLAWYCYEDMFSDCTSLTTAPALPATNLVASCYHHMFSGCTNLNSVKCLATDISATDCTTDWLKDVPTTGSFTKAADADWSGKTGANGIPSSWTVNNESVLETTGDRGGYGTKEPYNWN